MKKLLLFLFFCCSHLMTFAQAEIRFDKIIHDFGEYDLETTPIQKCAFKFTNIGNEPLIINRVNVASKALFVKYPTEPILPQKIGVLEVSYDGTATGLGSFNRSITIMTNGKIEQTRLYIKGNGMYEFFKPKPREDKKESDGFTWVMINSGSKHGVESSNGKMLIPTEYDDITYSPSSKGFFVYKKDVIGFYSRAGNNLIPISRGYKMISVKDDSALGVYFQFEIDGQTGLCDKNGKEVIKVPGVDLIPKYINGRFFFITCKTDQEGIDFLLNKIDVSKEVSESILNFYATLNVLDYKFILYGLKDGDGNDLLRPFIWLKWEDDIKRIDNNGVFNCYTVIGDKMTVQVKTTKNPLSNNK